MTKSADATCPNDLILIQVPSYTINIMASRYHFADLNHDLIGLWVDLQIPTPLEYIIVYNHFVSPNMKHNFEASFRIWNRSNHSFFYPDGSFV